MGRLPVMPILLATHHLTPGKSADARACCAWAVPWSITIARTSARCRARITLDITTPSTPCHGGQQLRLFNPITMSMLPADRVFDDVAAYPAVLRRPVVDRPANRTLAASFDRRDPCNWPRVESCCAPTAIIAPPRCCASAAPVSSIHAGRGAHRDVAQAYRQAGGGTAARAAIDADGKKLRRFKEFYDGAGSWDASSAFIVVWRRGRAGLTRASSHQPRQSISRTIYQDIYCARDRRRITSRHGRRICPPIARHAARASANQMRLFLHVGHIG